MKSTWRITLYTDKDMVIRTYTFEGTRNEAENEAYYALLDTRIGYRYDIEKYTPPSDQEGEESAETLWEQRLAAGGTLSYSDIRGYLTGDDDDTLSVQVDPTWYFDMMNGGCDYE